MERAVRVASRSIPPPWGSIRFRLALRTYAPCGPSVRVVSQTKSRKIPTRNVLPLFVVVRYDTVPDAIEVFKNFPVGVVEGGKRRQPFYTAQNGGQFGLARSPARPMGHTCSPRWGQFDCVWLHGDY